MVLSDFKFRTPFAKSLKSITRPYIVVISLCSNGSTGIEVKALNALWIEIKSDLKLV